MSDVAAPKTYRADLLAAYEDGEGNLQQASPATLEKLGKLLTASAAPARKHVVAKVGDILDIPAMCSDRSDPGHWQLCRDGRVIVQGREASAVQLPFDLPTGEYLLKFENDVDGPVSMLITPREAFQPAFTLHRQRTWLLGVQLYALASPENWGHGDFGDLLRILEICAEAGSAGVGVNPLHALFEHNPEEASPYAPSSRLFINPLYLDLSRLPGYARELDMAGDLPRGGSLMDYASVARVKYAVIGEAYKRFKAQAAADPLRDFAAFRRRKGNLLRRFAAFHLLQRRHGLNWRQWPEEWRRPDDARISALADQAPDAIGASEFAQWQCHSQLAACREYARRKGMAIGLYLDVAVGSHPDGFDAWNDQEAFLQGLTIGAPPDALNTAGQNWGLTAFNPLALIQRGFKPLRDILAASMEYAGAIRIDHILGLNRFYLIPEGASGRDGAYLTYPLRDLLAVLALESQQWQCLVIGEDLGTVPQGFREKLQAAGIWTYIVTLFEQEADGTFRDPAEYPYRALATFATHDLPPFAAWAEGRDLEVLQELGIPASENIEQRRETYAALLAAARSSMVEISYSPFECTTDLLGRAGSAVVAIALEDIFGQTNQLNVPGTHLEYPNWRHRTAISWAEVRARVGRLSAILQKRNSFGGQAIQNHMDAGG